MNRLQAGDLKTLLSLQPTAAVAPEVTYKSTNDARELEILSQGQGLGMELYGDDVRDADEFLATAEEFGISIDRE